MALKPEDRPCRSRHLSSDQWTYLHGAVPSAGMLCSIYGFALVNFSFHVLVGWVVVYAQRF